MKKMLALGIASLMMAGLAFGAAACGHTHALTAVAEKKATCQAGGNDAYWTCECGKIFGDAEGENELQAIPTTKKATTHAWDEGVSSNAQCGEEGEILYTCQDCQRTKTETVDAIPHQFNQNGVCAKEGCGYQTTGITYTEGSDVCSVSGYTGTQELVVIPAVHNGKPVTEIEGSAFANNKTVKEVVIVGNNMASIGSKAFMEASNLAKINLPESVTSIGWSQTFAKTAITEITLPSLVSLIPQYCFSGCSSLEKVVIKGTVSAIETYAFDNCTSLTEMNFPEGLQTIGASAFTWAPLAEVVLPSTLTAIADSAFAGCTYIENLTVAEGNTVYKVEDGCLIEIATNRLLFAEKDITAIPDGVTTIGISAFFRYDLGDIYIPKTVTKFEDKAFRRVNELGNKTLTINYEGNETEWNAITKGADWNQQVDITVNYNQAKA